MATVAVTVMFTAEAGAIEREVNDTGYVDVCGRGRS
jgi:hypothetical protein